MKDSYGRKINYLRISLTDRCNFRCVYCMPEKGIQNKLYHESMLSLEDIYVLIKHFVELGIDKVRFTGGEPLVRKGIVDLISEVGKLEGIKDLAMTTNGSLLKQMAKPLKEAGLSRVNISLDTLDPVKFSKITRCGDLDAVLKGIDEAMNVGLAPIKINTVLIGGVNDNEIRDLIDFTKKGIDVRFIELMPIGEAAGFAEEKFVSTDLVLKTVSELVPIEREDKSSPAAYYVLPGVEGKVGLINPISCKFCSNCNRVRITSTGKLKLCLHSNREIDLKSALENNENIKEVIKNAIWTKDESHHLEDEQYIIRNMHQIGG
ncbi:MAG TPA: GTP 3',8-cyclase MoaA [Oscillospiraceae bacterium]|nr:GTP 3',8-cyclase MoaA [Oscillospiraceae bacterium]